MTLEDILAALIWVTGARPCATQARAPRRRRSPSAIDDWRAGAERLALTAPIPAPAAAPDQRRPCRRRVESGPPPPWLAAAMDLCCAKSAPTHSVGFPTC